MQKYDRFEFEQLLLKTWNITDQIELLRQSICKRNLTEDQIDNYLLGIEAIYQQHFEELWEMFENSVKQGGSL